MNYCVGLLVVLLALSQVLCKVAAGNGLPEPGEDLGKEGAPIYIYMERLRKVTRTTPETVDTTGEDSQTPGTLLATSFKDTYVDGGQIGGGGVSSSIDLHFTVPRQSTDSVGGQGESPSIYKSELWLFPSFNSPRDDRWYQLTLGFVFRLEGFNRPVEAEVSNILWRGSDQCIMVDLTPQTKIIDRKLKKRDLNETLVHVRVTVHHKEEYHGSPAPVAEEWQTTCSSLSSRTTNTSFLVVKYFSDEEASSRQRRTVLSDGSKASSRQRRAAPDTPTNSNSTQGCSLTQLNVRLQDALGDWVTSPTDPVDVGVCSGECDIAHSRGLFSQRALLKERLRNQLPIPDQQFRVSCIALTVDPVRVLIHDTKVESYFLVNLPIKAKTCGCR